MLQNVLLSSLAAIGAVTAVHRTFGVQLAGESSRPGASLSEPEYLARFGAAFGGALHFAD
jgi:hypothetical protein